METNKQYLSVNELASFLHITPQYVRKLATEKAIPATMVGKTWVIDPSIIDDKKFVFKMCGNVPDQKRKSKDKPKYKVLSFFSGAMGLDIGLSKAGLEPMLASEIEPNTRKTILLNKPDIALIGDINQFDCATIRDYAGLEPNEDIDLVIGGPPCQAFSTAGKREGFNDSRGNVFLTFIDRILGLRPKFAVIENVRGLLSAPYAMEYPDTKAFGYATKTPENEKGGALLHIINLRIQTPYLNPTNSENGAYGLPEWKTLGEALNGLDESNPEYLVFPEKRLKYYRILKEGQYWKDLPEDLQKEALGPSYYLGGGKTGFLRRLDMSKPSPTLVTDPTMPATDLCHPYLDRPLSIQEYKRIQEFPDDWKLFGSIKDKYRQIGNAVPVSLGKAIGEEILTLLEGKTPPSPPDGFPFSRYKGTDEKSFKKEMTERINKKQNRLNQQSYLF